MASALVQLKEIWNRMPASGRIATGGAALGTMALIGALIYYGSQPNYGVLFSDLKPADAQSIVEKLKTANVPYALANGGTTVQVPDERIPELRLQMAGEGAISGGHVGFDLFDKTSFGATDFAQQINFRRAIEGELAKTLEGLDEIETARVHITPKKESVFTEKEEGAKASIVLRVRQNKELADERTNAIVSLVSSSIEGLDPSGVSVMDTYGRQLATAGKGRSGGDSDAGAFKVQFEAKQKFEVENAARIIALLEPVVGNNRVRADVAADIDFSQIEQSEERYDPKSQVIRSQQSATEARTAPSTVPNNAAGSRANNPAGQPVAAPAPAVTVTGASDQRNTSTVNYEIDKTIKKTIGAGGRVNRMTVSVVVDHKTVEGVEVARTAEEISQIQDLVAAAVGTDTNRGDSVVVQTMPFSKPEIDQSAPATFLESNRQLIPTVTKYGALVLIAILLLLFVVRPARKALKAASVQNEGQKLLKEGLPEGERRLAQLDPVKGTLKQLNDNSVPGAAQMMTVSDLEAQLDKSVAAPTGDTAKHLESIRKQITTQTLNDPETVVNTMRGWLRETPA